MKVLRFGLIAAAALFVAGCQARLMEPGITASHAGEARFMREYGDSSPPVGYVEFCRRAPGQCATRGATAGRVTMTRERWVELNSVNALVNRTVEPATDEEIYHQAEYWALPDVAGDCEDYVLEKRKLLIAQGWPESALLITVVRDEEALGHAVLTVATDMGDLVLDNRAELIRPWTETNYVYYKRQSRTDPRRWVALAPNANSNTALASVDAGRETPAFLDGTSLRDPVIPPH